MPKSDSNKVKPNFQEKTKIIVTERKKKGVDNRSSVRPSRDQIKVVMETKSKQQRNSSGIQMNKLYNQGEI